MTALQHDVTIAIRFGLLIWGVLLLRSGHTLPCGRTIHVYPATCDGPYVWDGRSIDQAVYVPPVQPG